MIDELGLLDWTEVKGEWGEWGKEQVELRNTSKKKKSPLLFSSRSQVLGGSLRW